MELEDNNEPPKKKLKQAQLPFCNQLVKTTKRKCSNDNGDNKQSCKMICKVDESDNDVMNKENLIVVDDSAESNDTSITDSETPSITANKTNFGFETKKELIVLVKDIAKNKDYKLTYSSDSAEEHIKHKDKIVSENDLTTIKLKDVTSSDKKKDENINTNLKSDIIEISNSDEENEINSTSDDGLNQSKSVSDSSEDEKSEGSNKNNVVSPNSHSEVNPLKRKLTPKALEKRKMRESIKQEKLEQKEREKEAKLKMKIEKEELRRKEKEEKEEQKKKEKEEKEEQRRKEKEEREKKRLADLKQKEDEKRLKELEKKRKEEAKEEEKRLKEEERRRKEEAKEEERRKKEEAKLIEQRKEDQAKKFLSKYFILKKSKTDNDESNNADANIQPKFMPFPVKPDMRLAEVNRRVISGEDKTKLDSHFNEEKTDCKLYINELKSGDHIPQKAEPTWPLFEEQHDVIIIESVVDGEMEQDLQQSNKKSKRNLKKAKLLQFHENRRPAYWGTWRTKSNSVTSRRPFVKDVSLNYEVDSDSEWEDEGEGEDIGNDDDSDKEHSDEENSDEKDENGYILDNTFVPHGYLSDEEVQPDEENFDPEDHKLRLKVLRKEFEEEMKMKAERLKPRILGCVWISNDTTAISKGSLYEILMKYRGVWDESTGPIKVVGPTIEDSPSASSVIKSKQFSPAVMEQLVKFVHGNHLPIHVLVQEFRNLMEKENCPVPSKRAVSIKIKEIAGKEADESGKHLWSVNNELRSEYGLVSEAPMNTSNIEKPKDTFLDNFLKRPSVSPQQTSKGIQSLSTPKSEPTVLQPPSTPTLQPIKKRATLITLPHTPPTNEVNKTNIKVHKDTPRPVHPFFKNVHFKDNLTNLKKDINDDGVIDLNDDDD